MNNRKSYLFFFSFFLLGCAEEKSAPDNSSILSQNTTTAVTDSLFSIISDKHTSLKALEHSLAALDTSANENSSFWSKIFNDSNYSDTSRTLCLMEMLKRKVRPGISVGQFSDLLDHPKWLKEENIRVAINNNVISVSSEDFFDPHHSFFIWYPFPDLKIIRSDSIPSYLSVQMEIDDSSVAQDSVGTIENFRRSKRVSVKYLFNAMTGTIKNNVRDARIIRFKINGIGR